MSRPAPVTVNEPDDGEDAEPDKAGDPMSALTHGLGIACAVSLAALAAKTPMNMPNDRAPPQRSLVCNAQPPRDPKSPKTGSASRQCWSEQTWYQPQSGVRRGNIVARTACMREFVVFIECEHS